MTFFEECTVTVAGISMRQSRKAFLAFFEKIGMRAIIQDRDALQEKAVDPRIHFFASSVMFRLTETLWISRAYLEQRNFGGMIMMDGSHGIVFLHVAKISPGHHLHP